MAVERVLLTKAECKREKKEAMLSEESLLTLTAGGQVSICRQPPQAKEKRRDFNIGKGLFTPRCKQTSLNLQTSDQKESGAEEKKTLFWG